MKKIAVTIAIAITMVVVMTLGLAAPVMAASPTHVIGSGLVYLDIPGSPSSPSVISFQATLANSDTGEATGQVIDTGLGIPSLAHGVWTAEVKYLSISGFVNPASGESSSTAWIGCVPEDGNEEVPDVAVGLGGSCVIEVQIDQTSSQTLYEMSVPIPLRLLNGTSGTATLQEEVSSQPDLFYNSLFNELYTVIAKNIIIN